MLKVEDIFIAGMEWRENVLWVAAPAKHVAAMFHTTTGMTEEKLTYSHEIWDLCPDDEGLWILTGGGKLGRQLVLWSLGEQIERRQFNCPDGAGAGMTVLDGRLWVAHRHNRKLFCLDPKSGKVSWVIRTENETFSPAVYKNELWLIECHPGPLGHWSPRHQEEYFFSRYDPVRERIVERLAIPFVPCSMAFDGERFWYAEQGEKGLSSAVIPQRLR